MQNAIIKEEITSKKIVNAVPRSRGETLHRVLLGLTAAGLSSLVAYLAITGSSYYSLAVEDRPFSPLHSQLRSSGTVGLRIGILSLVMFGILFLYPLRKRWTWLSRIGNTRRWLNFHILFGVATPVVVTFHTAFKWQGLAGLAYWTMWAVALSGYVGRYIYARIPRSVHAVKLSVAELQAEMAVLAERLQGQAFFTAPDLAPLLDVPAPEQARKMGLIRVLGTMLRRDIARPLLASRLRRQALSGAQLLTRLGGFLPTHDKTFEEIVTAARKQSRLIVMLSFLDRTERIFHLWHAIHRPFSISFVALVLIHIGVVLSIGF